MKIVKIWVTQDYTGTEEERDEAIVKAFEALDKKWLGVIERNTESLSSVPRYTDVRALVSADYAMDLMTNLRGVNIKIEGIHDFTPTAEQYRSAPFVSKLELEHDVVKKAVVEALGSANDILLNMIKATPEGDAKVPFGQHSSLSKAAIMLAHHQGYPLQVLVFDEWHDVTEFDGFNNSLVYKVLPKPVPWQKPPCPGNQRAGPVTSIRRVR